MLEEINKYIVLAFFCVLCWLVLPQAKIISDSKDYIEISKNLKKTERRPPFYPVIVRISQNQRNLTLIQALMCGGVFYLIYLTSGLKVMFTCILMGAYFLYIPYVMTDLMFAFFMICAYYFLKAKKLVYHFLFLLLASLTRPVLAGFFVIEPILVWLVYKDLKISILSFFVSLGIILILPLKNLIQNDNFIFSSTLGDNLSYIKWDFQYFKRLIFGNFFTTHWNKYFELAGYYKRNLNDLRGFWFVGIVDILFYVIYAAFYLYWVLGCIKKPDYFDILWVLYFSIPGVLALDIGSRCRLPFEFLIYKNNELLDFKKVKKGNIFAYHPKLQMQ